MTSATAAAAHDIAARAIATVRATAELLHGAETAEIVAQNAEDCIDYAYLMGHHTIASTDYAEIKAAHASCYLRVLDAFDGSTRGRIASTLTEGCEQAASLGRYVAART